MNIYFLSLLIFFLLFVFCKTEVNSLIEFSVQKRNHETLYSIWWFNCTQLVGVLGAALLLGVVRCIHTSLNWNEPWWSWCMRDLFKIRWKSIGNMTEWLFQSSFLLSAEQYCVIDRQLELEMCGHQSWPEVQDLAWPSWQMGHKCLCRLLIQCCLSEGWMIRRDLLPHIFPVNS